jgi:protein-L-isoaspartate(D-aspartate) O-methyltransferase
MLDGDGFAGWEENGPYDAIYVGAASETLPEALVHQLKPGGRMIIPGTHVTLEPTVGSN